MVKPLSISGGIFPHLEAMEIPFIAEATRPSEKRHNGRNIGCLGL